MEYIKILCCGKENGELSSISLLLERMKSVLGITIKKMTRVCLADFTQEDIDEENEEYYELDGTELLARAICHECEHLDGKLYLDLVEGELRDVTEEEDEEES